MAERVLLSTEYQTEVVDLLLDRFALGDLIVHQAPRATAFRKNARQQES
jgi:hypothetical protein